MNEQNANPVKLFGIRVAHVGINATDPADALEIAELFSTMMGLPVIEAPVSYFNDSLAEGYSYRGRRIVKRLPMPSTEVTPMTPPWLSTIHLAIASPRPEPCAPASRALSAR